MNAEMLAVIDAIDAGAQYTPEQVAADAAAHPERYRTSRSRGWTTCVIPWAASASESLDLLIDAAIARREEIDADYDAVRYWAAVTGHEEWDHPDAARVLATRDEVTRWLAMLMAARDADHAHANPTRVGEAV